MPLLLVTQSSHRVGNGETLGAWIRRGCRSVRISTGRSLGVSRAVTIGLFVGLLCLATVMVACGPVNTPPVVKIGLIAPFEGPSRSLGYSVLHAVRMRIEEWNLSGRRPRVELVALNDDGDPAQAVALPEQLAADPDVRFVLGPVQGPTAIAAAASLTEQRLPALLLAPIPETIATTAKTYGGTTSGVAEYLAPLTSGAAAAWEPPVDQAVVWTGDVMTLASLLAVSPEYIAGASSVAAEDALVAWAADDADGLIWTMATPVKVPDDLARRYQERTGIVLTPMAAIAYVATGKALSLMAQSLDRQFLLEATLSLNEPPLQTYQRQGVDCCVPFLTQELK